MIEALGRVLLDVARAARTITRGPRPLADLGWLCWLLSCRAVLGSAKRLLALPRLVRFVRAAAPAAAASAEAGVRFARIRAWLARRSPLLPSNCLERSLIVVGTWHSGGVAVELHVGFRRSEAATEGHTWVTAGGALLLESAEQVAPFESACVFDARGVRATSAAA